MNPEAPTAAELEQNPVVQAALAAAWADSLPNDPNRRHEEGGWIYLNPATGEVRIVRAKPGRRSTIDLSTPTEIAGFFVVGKFHTHPNPTAEGWLPEPSTRDVIIDE